METPALSTVATFCVLSRWAGKIARLGAFAEVDDQDKAMNSLQEMCELCEPTHFHLRLDCNAKRFNPERCPANLALRAGGLVDLVRFHAHVVAAECKCGVNSALRQLCDNLLPEEHDNMTCVPFHLVLTEAAARKNLW